MNKLSVIVSYQQGNAQLSGVLKRSGLSFSILLQNKTGWCKNYICFGIVKTDEHSMCVKRYYVKRLYIFWNGSKKLMNVGCMIGDRDWEKL